MMSAQSTILSPVCLDCLPFNARPSSQEIEGEGGGRGVGVGGAFIKDESKWVDPSAPHIEALSPPHPRQVPEPSDGMETCHKRKQPRLLQLNDGGENHLKLPGQGWINI